MYEAALQRWGKRRIEAQENNRGTASSRDCTRYDIETDSFVFVPLVIDVNTVTVKFLFKEGVVYEDTVEYSDAYVEIAGSEESTVRHYVVRIRPDEFDFAAVLKEILDVPV